MVALERLLGQFIKNMGQSARPVFVATKFFPMPWRWTSASVVGALRASLERLGNGARGFVPNSLAQPDRADETLRRGAGICWQLGLTRAVGVSNYDKTQMQRAHKTLAKFNVRWLPTRWNFHYWIVPQKKWTTARCLELGVRLIAYSPLAMGLFNRQITPEAPPSGVRARKYGNLLKKIQPLLRLMNEIGQDHDSKSAAQVALNW